MEASRFDRSARKTGVTIQSVVRIWIGLLLGGYALTALPAQAANNAAVDHGRELAFTRSLGNCLACHEMVGGKQPGNVGPPLKDMTTRFPDRQFLYDRIWDEQKFNPMTVMPPFGKTHALSKQEINDIIDFLYTL